MEVSTSLLPSIQLDEYYKDALSFQTRRSQPGQGISRMAKRYPSTAYWTLSIGQSLKQFHISSSQIDDSFLENISNELVKIDSSPTVWRSLKRFPEALAFYVRNNFILGTFIDVYEFESKTRAIEVILEYLDSSSQLRRGDWV